VGGWLGHVDATTTFRRYLRPTADGPEVAAAEIEKILAGKR
jgi:hypothetical protein